MRRRTALAVAVPLVAVCGLLLLAACALPLSCRGTGEQGEAGARASSAGDPTGRLVSSAAVVEAGLAQARAEPAAPEVAWPERASDVEAAARGHIAPPPCSTKATHRLAHLNLAIHGGPRLALFTEMITEREDGADVPDFGRTGNLLVEWQLEADGSAHAPSLITGRQWHTFLDPHPHRPFTYASCVWVGDTAVVIWEHPFPRPIGGAALAGGIEESLALPETAVAATGADIPFHGARTPDLCAAGGRVYLVAPNATDRRVGVARTAVGSPSEWEPYALTSLVGSVVRPSIAVGADGRIYVACTRLAQGNDDNGEYMQPRAGSVCLTVSADGSSWSAPAATVDEESAHSSALAVDEDLGLVLVYSAEREDGWPVFAARSADFGETWGEPVMLSEPDVYAFKPDALIDDGKLYVAYLELPPPTGDTARPHLGNPTGARTMVVDVTELPVP